MTEKKKQLIRITTYQKKYLDDIKEHPKESYVDALNHLISTDKEIRIHAHMNDNPKKASDECAANLTNFLRQRRVKFVYVDKDEICDLFVTQKRLPDCFIIRRFDLPADYLIHSVTYDPYRGSFVFSVLSSSFPPVPQGEIPSLLEFKEIHYTEYKIMEKEDG